MRTEPVNHDRAAWTERQVRALGVTTDLVTAAAILGIGRTTAHALARADRFPVPVLRVGRRYRVPVAPILRLLALTTEPSPNDATTTNPAVGQPPSHTSLWDGPGEWPRGLHATPTSGPG